MPESSSKLHMSLQKSSCLAAHVLPLSSSDGHVIHGRADSFHICKSACMKIRSTFANSTIRQILRRSRYTTNLVLSKGALLGACVAATYHKRMYI